MVMSLEQRVLATGVKTQVGWDIGQVVWGESRQKVTFGGAKVEAEGRVMRSEVGEDKADVREPCINCTTIHYGHSIRWLIDVGWFGASVGLLLLVPEMESQA